MEMARKSLEGQQQQEHQDQNNVIETQDDENLRPQSNSEGGDDIGK
jgi:hypothetical protein